MPVPQGRIVYSTGDLDYSIAARLFSPDGITMKRNSISTFLWRVRDWKPVYKHETHRQGKAKAGHYMRVFK
jgi:hypothetical protein